MIGVYKYITSHKPHKNFFFDMHLKRAFCRLERGQFLYLNIKCGKSYMAIGTLHRKMAKAEEGSRWVPICIPEIDPHYLLKMWSGEAEFSGMYIPHFAINIKEMPSKPIFNLNEIAKTFGELYFGDVAALNALSFQSYAKTFAAAEIEANVEETPRIDAVQMAKVAFRNVFGNKAIADKTLLCIVSSLKLFHLGEPNFCESLAERLLRRDDSWGKDLAMRNELASHIKKVTSLDIFNAKSIEEAKHIVNAYRKCLFPTKPDIKWRFRYSLLAAIRRERRGCSNGIQK